MLQKADATLLEQLEGSIAVDADTMNADFIRSLPIKCHDMTSNQRFVHEALTAEHNKEIVEGAVKELKGKSWEEVYAVCVSLLSSSASLCSPRGCAASCPSERQRPATAN